MLSHSVTLRTLNEYTLRCLYSTVMSYVYYVSLPPPLSQAATRSDSMTLTLGPWLGLPAVPAVTLYRHEDPALVHFLLPVLSSLVSPLNSLPVCSCRAFKLASFLPASLEVTRDLM